MALNPCVRSFILVVLCGNPILKGAFVTLLTSTVLSLDQEIGILTLQLGRLNFFNKLLNIELQTVQALISKVSADFNLILEPFKQYPSCPELSNLSDHLQNNAVNKKFVGLQNKLYEINRVTNLANVQDSIIKFKQKRRDDFQEIIDLINTLCP